MGAVMIAAWYGVWFCCIIGISIKRFFELEEQQEEFRKGLGLMASTVNQLKIWLKMSKRIYKSRSYIRTSIQRRNFINF